MTDKQYEKRREQLSEIFREAMKESGFGQKEIAEKLNVDKSMVSRDLYKNNISYKKLLTYCEALGLEVIIKPKG